MASINQANSVPSGGTGTSDAGHTPTGRRGEPGRTSGGPMAGLEWPNLGQMLVPDQSLAESFLRGVVVFFVLLMLFRVSLNRQAGGVGLTDVMLVVLVSECVSGALGGQAKSIPNGIAAVCGLLASSFLVDWA